MSDQHDVPPPVPPEALRGAADDAGDEYDLDRRATELVEGGIGLARLAVGSAWRTSRWGLSTSMQIAERVVGALASGESMTHAVNQGAAGARDALMELAGVGEPVDEEERRSRRMRRDQHLDVTELRRRGAELLRRSADVDYEESTHPAYVRILESLSPDEARMLRILDQEGPQPSVDVRTASAVPHHSELVEAHLTMLGELAGCRYVDRTKNYLNNLARLGLIEISTEQLSDPDLYQVIEAQPDVLDAMNRAKRAKTVRGSIHLTAFGEDFVRVCLTPEL